MKTKGLALILSLLMLMTLVQPLVAAESLPPGLAKKASDHPALKNRPLQERLKISGKHLNFDLPPVIKADRTLIPVRAITQGMGASVEWDEKNQIIVIERGDVKVTLVIGDSRLRIEEDGVVRYMEMDIPAQLHSNRTFVPLRFIAEALGGRVNYDDETGDIDVQVRLETPDRPLLVNELASWKVVDHENDGYRLRLFRYDTLVALVEIDHGDPLTADLSDYMELPGIYTVRVRALGTGDYTDSRESLPSQPQMEDMIRPATPTDADVDDEEDTFGWTWVPGYASFEYYEYSTDQGETWKPCTAQPQPVGDEDYDIGAIQVRVKADYSVHRLVGGILFSDEAYTQAEEDD